MGYQMRQFNFFQSELVINPPAFFKEEPTCFTSSEYGHLILGDNKGDLHLLDTKLNSQTFCCYEDGSVVTFAQYFLTPDEHPYLITIGEKPEEINPVLKVWDLHKVYHLYQYPFIHRKQTNAPSPTCIKTYKLSQSVSAVTSLAISSKKSTCAIGFKDGQVILFNGNVVKDRFVKPKIVHQCSEPITGLGFQNTEDPNQGIVEDYLYIVSTREIHALNLNSSKLDDKFRLDQLGAKVNCSTIINSSFHRGLVVGRDDAIYFYGPEGRGPCLAYEGTKDSVKYLGSHLIIISSNSNNASQQLDIYDLRNKLIAHTQNFPQGLYNLVYEFNGYFGLTKDFQLYRLEEKEVQSKIDILLNQDLYPLALNMSQVSATDASVNLVGSGQLAEIYRKYGDYLYNKGEFDNAMIQYLNTVGWLEPSYVIRKFLDAQRLHSLTQYLEALHQSDLHLANPDHTTLLINCYTKLKDPAKLTQFIQNPQSQYQFDLTTAIQVLQSAQYYDQALYLAEQHQLHKYYLKIVMEDLKQYEKGLNYLEKLELGDINQYLEVFGRIWLKECGESTLDMLIRVCTSSHILPSPTSPPLSPSQSSRTSPNPLNFTSMFIDHPHLLMDFLDRYISIVFEKNFNSNQTNQSIQVNSKDKILDKKNQPLFDQLLQLYLTHSPNSIPPQDDPSQVIDHLRQKALNLMQDASIPYDPNSALILCKTMQFDQGIVYLYDRLGMYSEILNYWCKLDRVDEVISTLYKYGPKDATLYELGLTYFASSPQTLLAHPMEFRRVLSLVEDQNLLMPLQVVQALSKNSVATIGSVKAYLERWVEKEQTKLNEEIDVIKEYSQETKGKREELKTLLSQGKVFQHTKCTGCNQVLQLPVVHFLCLHSYHQRCLGENTSQCPACSRSHQVVKDLYKSLRQESMDHQTFIQRLEHTHPQGRFELIGEYFSKGVFEMDESLDIFT